MKNILPIALYHGTSSIFLDSIIKHGLGGINPVIKWNLLDLSKEVFALSQQHLEGVEIFQVRALSFGKMVEQSKEDTYNWQHGDTYLSPSRHTAARYAINKRFGSELLTYTLDFLKELTALKIPEVTRDLYGRYKKVFGLIEASPSPIIVQASQIPINFLSNEKGEDCKSNLEEINEVIKLDPKERELYLQQTNFRLIKPVPTKNLKFWFINIQEWNPYDTQYNLYKLLPNS